MLFEQPACEIPAAWSQLATNVVVSKYFRGHLGTPARERSVKQMIDRFAVGQYGKDYGLRAGENLVNSEILQIQAFQGLTGQFDQQAYLAALGQRGLTDATFRRDLAIDLIEQQLLRPAK